MLCNFEKYMHNGKKKKKQTNKLETQKVDLNQEK